MNPNDFCMSRIPFDLEGHDSKSVVKLPSTFQKALDEAQEQMNTWTSHVRQILTKPEQQEELEAFTMRHFKEWLLTTGNSVQIESLTIKPNGPANPNQGTTGGSAGNNTGKRTNSSSNLQSQVKNGQTSQANSRDRVEMVSLE